MITRQSKFLFAFVSTQNPWWHDLITPPITQKNIASYLGISQSTIANWRKGGRIEEGNLKRTFLTLRKFVESKATLSDEKRSIKLDVLDRFLEAYQNAENWHVYDVSEKILGMKAGEDQKILDEVIFANFSILPSLSYESEAGADRDFKSYGGLYRAWIRRDEAWLRCALRVRYILDVQNATLIRCKLNLPVVRDLTDDKLKYGESDNNERYFEYDGFCRTHDDKVFWIFQKRELLGTDFIYFITSAGRNYGEGQNRRQTLCGIYLTTGQDERRSIVSGDVFLQRANQADIEDDLKHIRYDDIRISDDTTDIRKWMHQTAYPVRRDQSPEDYKYVDELWKAVSKSDDAETSISHLASS